VQGFGNDEGGHHKAEGGTEVCAAAGAPVRPGLRRRSVEFDDALVTTGT
jgi:hypothetical protein